jgi:DHA1 family bicyclomycin/chloramphenicol resistance-like MFS transporter
LPANRSSTAQKRQLTIIAALLAMLGPFSIDTYLPSFPDIEAALGTDRNAMLHSIGVYLVATAASTLLWGPLSDRTGRRLVVMISMSLYIIGSVGCAVSGSIEAFLLFRIMQGLAASGGFIAGRAMIRDAHDAQSAHRAMSQVMLLFAVAPAVAPVLGGWLHDYLGWRSVFWFLALFATALMTMAFSTGETLAEDKRQSIHPAAVFKVYVYAILHRHFLTLVMCLSFSFGGLFIYIAGATKVIYEFLGKGSTDFGWLFIPIVASMMLGAWVSGRLAHRWPARLTISTGLVMMLLASLVNIIAVLVFPANVLTVVGPLVVYVAGLSMMMPAITVLALDCMPDHRGTAASVQGFLQMVTNACIASLALPLLGSGWPHYVAGQVMFFILAAWLWLHFRRLQAHG